MTVIAVRSDKGGVGRTSVTALLAAVFARRGADITVMDLDRQDALRLYCGEVRARPAAGPAAGLTREPAREGFMRIAQDPASCILALGGPFAAQRAPGLLAPWLGRPEILIVDMPAEEDAAAAAVAALAGLHLRLFLPDLGSLARTGDPTQDPAHRRSVYLLNQADRRRPLSEAATAFLRHVTGARFAGEIRRDEGVPEAFAALQPLADYAPDSAALHDLQALCAELEVRFAAAARFESQGLAGPASQARRA